MVARAWSVRIHWAHPVRMRALVVGRPVLDALDDRLEGNALQAECGHEQQGKGLGPLRAK